MSWGAKPSLVQLVRAATSCVWYRCSVVCTPAHRRDGLWSIKSWLKPKSYQNSRNLAFWGTSFYCHWESLEGRKGWTLKPDSKCTSGSLGSFWEWIKMRQFLPTMIRGGGSLWRNKFRALWNRTFQKDVYEIVQVAEKAWYFLGENSFAFCYE